ncbi:MAG: histidine kinase, partial [Chitinophagaceae bacterium]
MFACRPKLTFYSGSLIVVSAILLLLAACSSNGGNHKFTVAFSQCTGGDDWRRTMSTEMKRELSFHPEIEFIYSDAEANSEKQIAQIREMMKAGIDLLIVTPNEVEPLTPIIGEVYESGIPVILVDRQINSRKFTVHIGASNFEVGQNAGSYAAALLKGKGRILEIAGLPAGASPPIDRHNGFIDIISHYPGMQLVGKFYSAGEEERQLLRDSTIDLIYAQNDFMAREAYEICKKLGIEKRVKIIGIDGLSIPGAGMEMVDKGIIAATVLYPTGGQEAIRTAVDILEHKPVLAEQELLTTIIDSTNIRITRLQNEKVTAQQADIDRRQRKIEEQELIRRNQSRIIWSVSFVLLLSLILGLVLFYALRNNRKISRRLAAKNAEIELQRNQLIELGQQAREANEEKVNFFTSISHELRTPLTLILGPADEIMAHPRLPVSVRSQLGLMKKNAMRLLRLVNELMDFRKIEQSKMKIRAAEQDITAFVTDITHAFAAVVAKKKISFEVKSQVEGLKVWFDVNMLDKILFNLLSNAVKYTGEYGFIHVVINRIEGEMVSVRVEDSGVGMEPETMEHAFDLFYQGEDGRNKG